MKGLYWNAVVGIPWTKQCAAAACPRCAAPQGRILSRMHQIKIWCVEYGVKMPTFRPNQSSIFFGAPKTNFPFVKLMHRFRHLPNGLRWGICMEVSWLWTSFALALHHHVFSFILVAYWHMFVWVDAAVVFLISSMCTHISPISDPQWKAAMRHHLKTRRAATATYT